MDLGKFVIESNAIEGIVGASPAAIEAHEELLTLPELTPEAVEQFVFTICDDGVRLRKEFGMNVELKTGYEPPPGGPGIVNRFKQVIEMANGDAVTPYQLHC